MSPRLPAASLLLALGAVARAAEPVPPVTPADRAAAFPEISATDLHAHMHMDTLRGSFEAEQLEWQVRSGEDAVAWDVVGWIGYDMNRLWLRDEGEKVTGEQAANELELLWGRPVAAWWDLVAGVRHDTGAGPSRSYAALGVQGLAPQWFDVEATAYVGERGQAGLGAQAEYHWLFTNRLVLTARLEGHAWSDDDEANGIGSGFSELSTGLRVRYEIRREFAPYVGVEWIGLFGDTADLARGADEDVRDTHLVAGLRFWF